MSGKQSRQIHLFCITNCELEFDYIPSSNQVLLCLHPEHKFFAEKQQAIDIEIENFLEKQIIESWETESEQVVSPIFFSFK